MTRLTHARSVGRTLGTTVLIQALGLVSGALVARMLGVENRGVLAAIVLWPAILANLGDLGGPTAFTYLAARRAHSLKELVSGGLVVALAQGVLLSAIGVPLLALALGGYGDHRTLALFFLVGYVPFNLASRYLNAINQGVGDFAAFNAVRIAVQGLYVAGIGALAITGSGSLAAVVAVALGSTVVATLLAVRHRLRVTSVRLALERRLLLGALRYGPRAHIGNLTPLDSMQLDLAVVILLLGPRDAGLYAIALAAAMIVRAQGTAVGMVALPTVAAKTCSPASGGLFRIVLLLNAFTATVLLAGADALVPLIYGDDFAPAATILRILTLGIVAASLRQVLGDYLRGAGLPLKATVSEVASWVVALAGFVLFVPVLGAPGAALAVSASYAVALILSLHFARAIGLSPRELFVPRREDFSLLLSLPRNAVGRAAAVARGTP